MEVTKAQIIALLGEALDQFYKQDGCLVDMVADAKQDNGSHHVGERAIVFRLAHYMQNIMDKTPAFKGYVLDCEYNRNGTDIKKLQENCVYPDVIIHKRQSKNNLLVMEVKTYWNNDTRRDMKKILEFMKNRKYKYKFGVSLIIEKKREEMSFKVLSESDNLCL